MCYFLLKSHTKKIPPTNPVTIPIGISSGGIIVRAAISAQSKNIDHSNAERGKTRK